MATRPQNALVRPRLGIAEDKYDAPGHEVDIINAQGQRLANPLVHHNTSFIGACGLG